ncbi:MAG: glycogen/starch synthase [candidate division KSB1 bacterium]|nr:glycogen/starch synthase [candidate division KSB1 bacterium]MDZ7301719.1 glycogen/starch synthase [candidate division KSB1 bacterium]MDZ7312394.1 glycogen/starch synthase [candidate division KSB1 bacterium]
MNTRPGQKLQHEIIRVVHVAREYGSLAGAGGIKDVTEGLCKATAAAGIDTHIFLPYYQVIREKTQLVPKEQCRFELPMNYTQQQRTESVKIYGSSIQPNLTVHLIKAHLYDYLSEGNGLIPRKGIYQYTREEAEALGLPERIGKGYHDFFAMNVLLVKATLCALGKLDLRPDVIHCHDGHAALLPLIAQASDENWVLPFFRYVPSVITVHNAGMGYHQDIFDLEFAAAICGVSRNVIDGCRLNGNFDPLLAGGLFGTIINTVSENYARELQHTGQDWMTGWLGHTLAQYGIKLVGVTNGINPEIFDPQKPEALGLAKGFAPINGDFEGKEICKQTLLESLGQKEIPKGIALYGTIDYRQDIPLLTFIGRLDQQKGFDILAEAVDLLFDEEQEVQLLGLGDGDPAIRAQFTNLAEKFAGRICVAIGYSPPLANKIYAAGDFFLIPSRFEPCGLTDFFAQLMGNVPIVHQVGGLVKTLDGQYGLSYLGGPRELLNVLRRALEIYREPGKATLRKIQINAVKNIHENFTWEKVLEKKYLPLYREAMERVKPALPY